MKRCVLYVVFASIGGALAQTPEKLKLPGPDPQNLMLGTWKTEAQYERTAHKPNGGAASGIEAWRPGPGGLSVIEESSEKNARGDSQVPSTMATSSLTNRILVMVPLALLPQ